MIITEIRDRHDTDGGEGVLAILILPNQGEQYPMGLGFVTSPSDDVQLATIRHPQGWMIPSHLHPPRQKTVQRGGEVLVVRSGRVLVTFYNSRSEFADIKTLQAGDVMMFVAGGHGFYFAEESELVEIRVGPYDPATDKVKIVPPVRETVNGTL